MSDSLPLAEDALLGNTQLHQRFHIFTDILGTLVHFAPDAVPMDLMQKRTGYLMRDLARHCSILWQALLIAPAAQGAWRLMRPAHEMTLEDVFRCVQASQATPLHPPAMEAPREATERFLGQAALTVNQAIARELRGFCLARLRFDGSEQAGFSPHFLAATRYDAGSVSTGKTADGDALPPLPVLRMDDPFPEPPS